LQLNPGTYNVTFSGPGLPGPITNTVSLGTANVRLNVTPATHSAPVRSVADDTAWVGQQYQTLLHRKGSQVELGYWANLLQQRVARTDVTGAIRGSTEFKDLNTAWVKNQYRNLLGRSVSDADVNYWVAGLQAGQSPTSVAAAIVESGENQQLQWAAWIPQAYNDILKRNRMPTRWPIGSLPCLLVGPMTT